MPYPFRSNGTPRQPQLVSAARSRLVLCPNIPAACLEGLTQYSHCWVLYVFHANTGGCGGLHLPMQYPVAVPRKVAAFDQRSTRLFHDCSRALVTTYWPLLPQTWPSTCPPTASRYHLKSSSLSRFPVSQIDATN